MRKERKKARNKYKKSGKAILEERPQEGSTLGRKQVGKKKRKTETQKEGRGSGTQQIQKARTNEIKEERQ